VTLLLRFLKADWPRALAFAAVLWLLSLAVELVTANFEVWQSTTLRWTVNAPLLFAVFVLLRVILFFLAYSMFYARRMSFDDAYKRFAAGRL
jgi:hypothetical protein